MATTTWNTDATHTDVQLSAKHMMVTTVRGKFNAVEGSLQLDDRDPVASSGTFSVRAASINTGVEARDNHLRSVDFLDSEAFPTIEFTSTRVEAAGGNDYRVTGDLTIRGTTRPITFDVEFLGVYQGFGGARRAGFHATTKLNREDWGLTWNRALESGSLLVGKEIKLEIDLAVEEARAAATGTEGVAAAA
jgi:polyisoprenoid-binding protein YceI